jgi:hypothetical protein
MANKKISQLTPKGSALAGTDLLEVSVFNGATYDTKSLTGANVVSGLQPTLFSGTNIKTINSTSLLGSGDIVISTGLTVGTTAIASGTVGRVLFEGTGNVVQQDSTLFWDNTNKRLGVGATPATAVRLDVRAQGALSTDIALRVRNSADSANLFSVQGDGVSNVLTRFNCGFSGMTTTGGALHVYAGNSSDFISRWFNTAGAGVISIRTVSNGGQLTISDNTGTAGLTLDGQNSNALTFGAGRNIYFDTATGTKIGATTSQKFAFWNATPIVQPTTAVASATVVSGSGGNVKHDDTFDGYTLEKVVKALRNTGLLA